MKKYFIIECSDGRKWNVKNKTKWLITNNLFHLDRSLRNEGWQKDSNTGLQYKCEKEYVESLDDIELGEVEGIVKEKEDEIINTIITEDRILIIPDLHAPFLKKGYLEFCKKMYDKYNCKTVVLLGDILDNHFTSYFDSDPDGYGAGYELEKAKEIIKGFYEVFPIAKVCWGNHDRLTLRKAFTSGVSKTWIKDMKQVLEVPNWEFKDHFIINNRLYYHGDSGKPRMKAREEMMSCVAGHHHSQSYIEFFQNSKDKRIFSMQLGCGIDVKEYAFAYAKFGKPPHINCGVIIDDVPIIEYMDNINE